jgi:hypothetical protein
VAQLLRREIDVAQSAVSSSWGPLEQGQQPPTVHFAQINERDGFLIAGRHPDAAFSWDKLLSGGFMFVHGVSRRPCWRMRCTSRALTWRRPRR